MTARTNDERREGIGAPSGVNPWRGLVAVTTGGLGFLIAVAPWPIGSVEPWAFWFLAIVAWSLLLFRGLALVVRAKSGVFLPLPVAIATVALVAALVWGALQASTLLPAVWIHPIRLALPPEVHPVSPAISLDPDRTVEAVVRWSTYLAVGTLAYLAARDRSRAERLLRLFLIATAVQAGWGLVREAAGLGEVLGYRFNLGRVSGSFVNANHFATYINLGLVAVAVLLFDRIRGDAEAPTVPLALARAIRALLERHLLLGLSFVLLLMASLASGSRGGFISLVLVLPAVLAIRVGRGRLALALVVVLATLGAFLLVTGGLPTLERLDALVPASEFEPGAGGRLAAYALAIEAWLQRPWLGHGLGAWPAVFHTFRDERFPTVQFDFVHNTWLELLVELGAPAFVAWAIGLLLLTGFCLRAAIRRTEPLPAIGFAGACLLGVHGLLDFPAQIPAIAVTFAVVFGLALGRAANPNATRRRLRAEKPGPESI